MVQFNVYTTRSASLKKLCNIKTEGLKLLMSDDILDSPGYEV